MTAHTSNTEGASDILALRTITARDVEMNNALYRHRDATAFAIDGLPATLRLRPTREGEAAELGYWITFTIGERDGYLDLDRGFATALLKRFDPKSKSLPTLPAHVAMAFEGLLAPVIDAFEQAFGAPLRIMTAGADAPPHTPGQPVGMALTVDSIGETRIRFYLQDEDKVALGRFLADRMQPPRPSLDIAFPVVIQLAAIDLTLDDLKSLGAGDTVIVVDTRDEELQIAAVVADSFFHPVVLTDQGAKITGPARVAPTLSRELHMSPSEHEDPSDRDGVKLGHLPVKVAFEIGRLELPLSELSALGEGTVLPLSRPLEQAVDIVANGTRVGRGTIVKIGDSVGVEVVRMFDGG